LIPVLASQFASTFGRESGGLIHSYETNDATTIVVALGSVLGTIKDAVDQRRALGDRVGSLASPRFGRSPLTKCDARSRTPNG